MLYAEGAPFDQIFCRQMLVSFLFFPPFLVVLILIEDLPFTFDQTSTTHRLANQVRLSILTSPLPGQFNSLVIMNTSRGKVPLPPKNVISYLCPS